MSMTPYEKSPEQYTEITETTTHYLGKDLMPINTVTRPGFENLVKLKRHDMIWGAIMELDEKWCPFISRDVFVFVRSKKN